MRDTGNLSVSQIPRELCGDMCIICIPKDEVGLWNPVKPLEFGWMGYFAGDHGEESWNIDIILSHDHPEYDKY